MNLFNRFKPKYEYICRLDVRPAEMNHFLLGHL